MLCKDAEAKKLAIGLMSGTSADGIDAVLVEISGCSTNTHVRQMAFVTLPFTDAVRSRILQVAAGNFGGSEELCLMNFLLGKVMCFVTHGKINPLIGSAGVSAVPMAARVSQKVGQEYNPRNYLLMHAMGPNVAGVIGSAVAAGILINMFG